MKDKDDKRKERLSVMVQYLVCADARVSMEVEGLEPEPEFVNGKDTGRVSHTWDDAECELVINFERGISETVVFKGCFVDAR